jgi:hypothetical protein
MIADYETKELAQRKTDALTITLWWVRGTMDTFVTVLDTDQQPPVEYCIDVRQGQLPHEVYQHALAYLPSEGDAA